MANDRGIGDVKATLNEVSSMLEEIRSHVSTLSEDQMSWVPPGGGVWPIQRSVAHCVNCEHRAATDPSDGSVPGPVRRWQKEVHVPGIYDLEVDTSAPTSEECAGVIVRRIEDGWALTAFERLAGMSVDDA
ncbi:MAG: hypothetical protein QGH20_04500 [Candidatus Latescibacteria bacterium]|jgi:hypothetical protein|nr:hypothetical protein [Candidatus Latescibacterota bacterium]